VMERPRDSYYSKRIFRRSLNLSWLSLFQLLLAYITAPSSESTGSTSVRSGEAREMETPMFENMVQWMPKKIMEMTSELLACK